MRELCDATSACLESLEPRRLFNGVALAAATPAAYNLYNLMYTKKLGAWWTYDGDFAVTGDATDSGAGSITVGVLSKARTFDGHAGTLVYANSDGVDGKLGFYKDADGVHAATLVSVGDFGSLSVNLHGTVIAPPALTVGGAASSDGGTFDGKLTFDGDSLSATGTITGKATVKSQLLRTQRITVPAGTFGTVKGTTLITLSGTLKVRAAGRTFNFDYDATIAQTFWAAPGTGLVKFNSTNKIAATDGEDQDVAVKVDTHANLTGVQGAPVPLAAFAASPSVVTRFAADADDDDAVFA
jgi:hypothetical protein